MFGMGFLEIMLVAVIAVIALGPEKLPTAMVDIARFIKKLKSGVDEAKTTIDNELSIADMKAEANKFKAQIEDAKSSINVQHHMDLGIDNLLDEEDEKPRAKKKKKKKVSSVEDEQKIENKAEPVKEETTAKAEDKFKVKFDEENKEDI